MAPIQVKKRDNTFEWFNLWKIRNAIYKGMKASWHDSETDAQKIANQVEAKLNEKVEKEPLHVWSVEWIQDLVEDELMTSDFKDVAKAYILYREQRTQERKRNIFKKRMNLKPYEYPELLKYVDAIRHSYWIHTEFNFTLKFL